MQGPEHALVEGAARFSILKAEPIPSLGFADRPVCCPLHPCSQWPVVPDDASGSGGWLVAFDDSALMGLDLLVGRFWQLKPKAGHIITDHAADALKERVFDLGLPIRRPGLPVMAPYFDMAFGWGVGCVLWLAPGLGETMRSSVRARLSLDLPCVSCAPSVCRR